MKEPDFDRFNRALGQALESIPIRVKGDRDLWYLRSEVYRLQTMAQRFKIVKKLAQQIAKDLGSKRPNLD